MNYFLAVHIYFIFVESKRPNFREDYQFEEAFGAFYKVHYHPSPWSQAVLRCESEGTELYVPESLDEADSVPILITNIGKFEGVFIGIHDLYSEKIYIDLKGDRIQSTILELLWDDLEPRNGGGRCVGMSRSGQLFTRPCHKPLPFICKIITEKIKYNEECSSYNAPWVLGKIANYCYLLSNEAQSWYDAYYSCLASGGQLATFINSIEVEYIRDMFHGLEVTRIPDNDVLFLGFSDLLQRHYYRTVFNENMHDLDFVEWEEKKICSKEDQELFDQRRCGCMRRNGLLDMADCRVPSLFACKKQANVTGLRNVLRDGFKQEHSVKKPFQKRDYNDFY